MSALKPNGRCPVCGNRKQRSSGQNRRYWSLIRLMAKKSKEFSAETWHEYFAREFLPMVEIQMPDLTTELVRMSTHDLPMHRDPNDPEAPNWDDYTLQVEAWCAERGVYLPD